MNRTLAVAFALALAWPAVAAVASADERPGAGEMFSVQGPSGELPGWKLFSEDPAAKVGDVWKLTDEGELVSLGTPKGYIYTEKDYTDFVLRLEWRWPADGPGRGGVLLRTTGPNKIWPKSLEAQINAGDAGDFWGLDGYPLAGPAERMKTVESPQFGTLTNLKKTAAVEKPPGEWNTYKITACGDAVTLVVNGQPVNRATGCAAEPGKICLTAEGDEIHFRNVRLSPIKEVDLLEGNNLSQWTACLRDPDAKMEDVWSVADGVLSCTGQPVGYLRTKKQYTNYILKFEWRWPEGGKPGNNGVLLRIVGPDKVWPKSVEAQLAGEHTGDIFTIDQFPLQGDPERTQGRYTAKAQPSNEKPPGEWNTYEIIVDGTDLTLIVNGVAQNIAHGMEEVPGAIAFQSEGVPAEYRNLRLEVLGE